jgi:hypothetical protein
MPRTAKPKDPFAALPKRVRQVIETCRSGQTLCRHFRTLRYEGEAQEWFFEPSGKRCTASAADHATRTQFLAAQGDGLFRGDDQTWRASL